MRRTWFYAVAVGYKTGVFSSWEEIKPYVSGYIGAKYKKFSTREEAETFIKTLGSPLLAQWGVQADSIQLKPITECPHAQGTLVVFTDGSALANGRKNARAAYAVVWPLDQSLNEACALDDGDNHTNNRAEYMACIRALEISNAQDPSKMKTLYIYTDSMLLINSVTKWMPSWKGNNWRKKSNDPVLNVDLLQRLDALVAHRRVVWKHVRAHTQGVDWLSTWNEKADTMAKQAAVSMERT